MVDTETNILINLSAFNLSKLFLNLFFNAVTPVLASVALQAGPEVTSYVQNLFYR